MDMCLGRTVLYRHIVNFDDVVLKSLKSSYFFQFIKLTDLDKQDFAHQRQSYE